MKTIFIIAIFVLVLTLSGCLDDPFEITGEEFQSFIELDADKTKREISYMGIKNNFVFLRIKENIQNEVTSKIRYAKISDLNPKFKKSIIYLNKSANLDEVTERNKFLQYLNAIFN